MPTSHINAVPFGNTRASAVGTCVCVPSTAVTRPSRCQPSAIFFACRLGVDFDDDRIGLRLELLDHPVRTQITDNPPSSP